MNCPVRCGDNERSTSNPLPANTFCRIRSWTGAPTFGNCPRSTTSSDTPVNSKSVRRCSLTSVAHRLYRVVANCSPPDCRRLRAMKMTLRQCSSPSNSLPGRSSHGTTDRNPQRSERNRLNVTILEELTIGSCTMKLKHPIGARSWRDRSEHNAYRFPLCSTCELLTVYSFLTAAYSLQGGCLRLRMPETKHGRKRHLKKPSWNRPAFRH